MIDEISLRDRIVEKLSATHGESLEIVTHVKNPQQMELFVEEVALSYLGSDYATLRAEKMMRLSECWNGASRQDFVAIGSTPEYKPGRVGIEDF